MSRPSDRAIAEAGEIAADMLLDFAERQAIEAASAQTAASPPSAA